MPIASTQESNPTITISCTQQKHPDSNLDFLQVQNQAFQAMSRF